MRFKPVCAIAILGLALSGCSLPRGAAVSNEILREKNAEEPTYEVVFVSRSNMEQVRSWPATGWSGGYSWPSDKGGPNGSVIRAGDTIKLVIWDSQENSLLTAQAQKTVALPEMQVSPTGTVFVPYLGNVVINGLTPERAREQIQTEMAQIAPSAQVQLAMSAGARNSVDLVSGIGKPGNYPLADRSASILSLIAESGGISAALKHPLVRLMRGSKTYEIRAERLLSDANRNITLRGGDKIVVREDDRYFTSLGATGKESLIQFEKEDITALEAVSLVGGILDTRANPEGLLVLREYPQKAVRADGIRGPKQKDVVFSFDLTTADGLFAARNFEINPKDTVLATESPAVALTTVFGLLRSVVGLSQAVN
ncbi:polysaccharide biosynthesis/export family protein [Pseudorhodobacter sp.]|uniref:polysaccharide biosynthesis/export family protein n=1 Tax=Pseudorhodobacter sp. TaxID=1934400 RepID=UPI0026475800|nr:polysaccharide biosynthesis/export family protein [Pseudorhodobacter sp.]MDN5788874.1 polysaccharide export protein [Pseudorhodobacter sp.]